jgi:hypothetical protein
MAPRALGESRCLFGAMPDAPARRYEYRPAAPIPASRPHFDPRYQADSTNARV